MTQPPYGTKPRPSVGPLPVTAPLPLTAGRRRALAFGVPTALLVLGSGVLGVTGWPHHLSALLGRNTYQVQLPVPVRGGAVTVLARNGDVSFRPGTGPAHVTARVRYQGQRPSVTAQAWPSPAGTMLESSCTQRRGPCSVSYATAVPAGVAVNAIVSTGDVVVADLRTTVTVHAGTGDVQASGLAGPARIEDQAGDVTLAAMSSPRLAVQSRAGDITGTGLAVGDITASDDAGNITLSFARVPSRVQVTCPAGDVTLVLPAGSTTYRVAAQDSAGSVVVTVPTSPSSTHLISVIDSAGDITIRH